MARKAKKMYKMVPLSPGVYTQLEALKDTLGCASFDELFAQMVGTQRVDAFGSWKGEPWLKGFKRDKFDRV